MTTPRAPSRWAPLAVRASLLAVIACAGPRVASAAPPTTVVDYHVGLQDRLLVVDAPGLLGNDADPDGDPITLASQSTPVYGSLASISASGAFDYTPPAGFVGRDSFPYIARDDADALSSTGRVFIEVVSANARGPVAVEDRYAVAQDGALSVPAPGLLANDVDPGGASLSVALVQLPANGDLDVFATGEFAYVPDPGFAGSDAFEYRARNATGTLTELAPVTIEVRPDPNRPPLGVRDAYGTPVDETLAVAAPGVLGNDFDPDGDDLRVVTVRVPAHGTVSAATDGSFSYVPDPGFAGADRFRYRMRDAGPTLSEETSVVIFVPEAGVGTGAGAGLAIGAFGLVATRRRTGRRRRPGRR
ncbi:MAG: Ig-like domain-containing protein [Myxococcota bacterium]